MPANVPALPTRRSESAAARLTRAQRARRDAAHMSEGVCRDITIFDIESRTSIAAERSRSEREAAHAFVSRWAFNESSSSVHRDACQTNKRRSAFRLYYIRAFAPRQAHKVKQWERPDGVRVETLYAAVTSLLAVTAQLFRFKKLNEILPHSDHQEGSRHLVGPRSKPFIQTMMCGD